MARIRTIKPELPQSENLGAVSFAARLLFILLLTVSDDEGRLAANPRVLVGQLFPFDDDAHDLIGGWLDELERVACIQRYMVACKAYISIPGWSKHQKIDKPTPSRLPAPPTATKPRGSGEAARGDSQSTREDSATTRESSECARAASERAARALAVGPWTMDHGPTTVDQGELRASLASAGGAAAPPGARPKREPKSKVEKPEPPTNAAWAAYATAYRKRYGADPVRNRKINGQLTQLLARLGVEEAPKVAALYVGHQNTLYVRAMHPVELLLRDAEKLRTEWATGHQQLAYEGRSGVAPATTAGMRAYLGLPAQGDMVDMEQGHA